jgi:tetratricopeptide (TPR) repeat protein
MDVKKILREIRVIERVNAMGMGNLLVQFFRVSLFLTMVAAFSSCSVNTAPARKSEMISAAYDTTLYNITYLEAIRLKMLGSSSDALAYFEQALKINPKSDVSAYEISRISFSRGDLNSAIKYGQIAYEIDSNNQWYLNHLATLYYSKGEIDSVIIVFEKIVANDPQNEEIFFNLGGLYIEAGRASEAEIIFREFKDRYGDNDQIVFALLNSMSAQNKKEETEQYLLELIDNDPGSTTFRGMLAENYRKYGERERAMAMYEEMFNIDPDNGILQMSYIDFLHELGELEELSQIVDNTIMNDSIAMENKIAIVLSLAGNEQYVKRYKNNLVISALLLEANYKNSPDAGLALATVYGMVGEVGMEIEILTKIANQNPTVYGYWEQLLIKVNEQGDLDLLYTLCEKVTREFNIYPLPKLFYAFAAVDKEEFSLAISELSKVRILVNEQPEFMVQILSLEADIFYKQGEYDKAFGKYEDALKINPEETMILNNYAYFLSEQNVNLKRAEELIQKCLETESNITYLDTYAWVLYKLGKYKQAESIMEGIFSEDIYDAELLEHYGFILKALKKCDEALIYLNASVTTDPSKTYLNKEIEECLKLK